MIELLIYSIIKPDQELFHFSEITTLEVTTLLDDATKIKSVKLVAYHKNDYLEKDVIDSFKTIEEFNRFFINNRRYFLHDCELYLEDDVNINSHDDGEVNISTPIDHKNRTLIKSIFRMKGLAKTLMEDIMKMPGYYVAINGDGKIGSIHETFDDYLSRGK
jgi:hypothetical protein